MVELTERLIYIVGRSRIQNELLGSFLEQNTKAKCLIAENLMDIPMRDDSSTNLPWMILLDCFGKHAESLLVEFESFHDKLLSRELIMLLNLDPGLNIEKEALMRRVRGFFYIPDPLELIPKGVSAAFRGELWVSREIMSKSILNDQGFPKRFKTYGSLLTQREVEIVTLVASGAKNAEVADQLFISPHTVKTHLYTIYKKINVSSRLEAALWATRNL